MARKNPFIQANAKYKLTLISIQGYELECYVFESKPNEPSLYVRKLETDSYNYISDFYRFGWDAKEIKEDLLPTIDEVIVRNWGDEILCGELLRAIVEPKTTFFTNNHNLGEGKKEAMKDERMQIDTKDFKEISLKWLEFLERQGK